MKKQAYRICSFFLVIVLCISMLTVSVPASAAYAYNPEPTGWNVLRSGFFDFFKEYTSLDADTWMNQLILNRTGRLNTKEELQAVATDYNSNYGVWARGSLGADWFSAIANNAVIKKDEENGIWRLWLERTEAWVVNTRGEFPYVEVVGDVPTDGPGTAPAEVPATPSISGNKFVDARLVTWGNRAISTKDALGELVVNLGKEGVNATLAKNNVPKGDGSGKYVEMWCVMNAQKTAVYCNSKGWPYTANLDPAAVDNNFGYIINNGDNNQTVVDNKVIDTSNNQMTVINENGDKVTYNIDSLYWDDSTHSYTANTYNVVNNTYNYYTWNITYNITNTYINYIGSNAAYQQEEYKYYYELPDGRSSEDLTAEEVAAMSFQFADVTNYARSATDTSLRALYHFDGNTEDSGYFSTQTKFKWDAGASITYMDSASFNGALYLDETAHSFDIDLPSNLGSGDFSVQWRHYQASQPDTLSNINNSFAIGGVTIMKWDERSFYWNGSSTPTVSVPIGSWHEIALIRNNGTLYFYINGVKVASKADTTGYQGKLMFSFGTTNRAYTMLDELRVVNLPIAKAGANYQCATAPFDTNLVLVLPDGAFPIADEYWKFNATGNLLPSHSYDFTTGSISPPGNWSLGQYVSAQYFDDSVVVRNTSAFDTSVFFASYGAGTNKYSIYFSISMNEVFSGPLTFSVYTDTNELYSFTTSAVSFVKGSDNRYYAFVNGDCVYKQFSNFYISVWTSGSSSVVYFQIMPLSGKSIGIRYAEVVKGSTPNTGHEKISCVYSSEEIKPNTAAVQSAIPVNGYTVGGVRPTFPVRGDVWFPVEGRRITGCYQYDGSMWRTAGCRYYTGTRWIPIYAFDIYTLADCWDIADAGVDSTPPITTETGFWNWFKKEWNDFRKWGNTSVELIIKAIVASGGASTEECTEHKYHYKDIKSPTCTAKGSRLFTCTKCGDTYTEDVDALGHDWLQIDDIQDTTDESGNTIKGYALWECSRCKLQHKDYDRTGPPPAEGESTITELITNLFDKLGGLVGSVIDWLLELGTEAVDGLGDIGDYFKSKAEEVGGFGGEFLLLLSGFFAIIPPELMTCMSLAIVFLALGLFVKKVLLK